MDVNVPLRTFRDTHRYTKRQREERRVTNRKKQRRRERE